YSDRERSRQARSRALREHLPRERRKSPPGAWPAISSGGRRRATARRHGPAIALNPIKQTRPLPSVPYRGNELASNDHMFNKKPPQFDNFRVSRPVRGGAPDEEKAGERSRAIAKPARPHRDSRNTACSPIRFCMKRGAA